MQWLGREAYETTWARQKALVEAIAAGAAEQTLLLVEHDPVITLGRKKDAQANVLSPGEIPVLQVERGGDATYHIEDGKAYGAEGPVIVGELPPGGAKANTFLRTEKEYADFVFKVDLKLVIPGNSGIQFRSHQKPATDPKNPGRVYGYQMEVDPSDRKWSGGIYDEARRGWL